MAEALDISDAPELLRLVEEVRETNEPRILRRGNEELAVITALPPHQGKTEADYEAFRSAAGGWKGLVDTDKLIEDIYESRRISSRPPVDL